MAGEEQRSGLVIETKKKNVVEVVKTGDGKYLLTADSVELNQGDSLDLVVTLEKLPLTIVPGERMHGVEMDVESPVFAELKAEIDAIRELPERKRPRKLVELIRSRVKYPYKKVVEELRTADEEKYKWIQEKLKLKTAKLSECLAQGFAECDQFAVLLLALGNMAGLEGTVCTYHSSTYSDADNIVNVLREDNGEPLYKSIAVGEQLIDGHSWVEFKLHDETWMPVDPTTNLIGDNNEDLRTFEKANFGVDVYLETDDKYLWPDRTGLMFLPGESIHTGIVRIRPRKMDVDDVEQEVPYKGSLKMDLYTRPEIMKDEMPQKIVGLTASII